MTFPKRYFASKSANKLLRYHQNKVDDISAICWPILMQNSVLETSLFVDYMTEIWIRNFKNFMENLGSEVEICWKNWDLWPHFLE
jgi:hypothetical protein